MRTTLHQRNKGFTIVEVMIVLVIGGLIMLIVFLAVPQLQRNSRNNARTSDVTRTVNAVSECLTNTNGTVSSCNNLAGADVNKYIDIADNSQLTEAAAAPALNAMTLAYGKKCNAAGTANDPTGVGAKSFTINYLIETRDNTTQRCLGS